MANIVLNYQYYLTNVNWTNEYKNVLAFADKDARNAYFDVDTIFADPNYNLINFNITNFYKTTVVIDCSDYITAMQSNYLIIKNNAKNEYYFYFITNARQTNFNRIELNIELDVYQQYYYDVTLPDCPINRCKAPINVKYDIGKYMLDPEYQYAENSEPIDYELTYAKQYKLHSIANQFTNLMSIVNGFMYIFVDSTHNFELKSIDNQSTVQHAIAGYATDPDGLHGIYNNIGVICAPIYNSSKRLRIKNNNDFYILQDAYILLETLRAGNSGADAAYVYSVKISRRPPFSADFIKNCGTILPPSTYYDLTVDAADVNDELYLQEYNSVLTYTSVINVGGYYTIRFIKDTMDAYTYEYSPTQAGIAPFASDYYDPVGKLAAAQYTKCYLDFGDGNKLELDYAKINSNYAKIAFKYKEAIVPDITRYSICVDSKWYKGDDNDGIEVNNQTFTADMSLIYTLDQWSSFLANNKNFYAQGNFNTMMKINKGVVGGAIASGQMNYLKAASSIANIYADTLQFVKNRDYQVDNLKESVDRVINQNGNACFNLIVKGIIPSIVVYKLPTKYQASVLKYLKMYGVNTKGLFGNIKTMMDNNSLGFHYAYIQADLDEIKTGIMSLECEKRFTDIFKDGVRFWYDAAHMYDYNY